MQRSWGLASSVLLLAACAAHPAADSARQPNLVFILVDDLGWQDLSVPLGSQETGFNRLYRTPHLERMAREGMVFTQAYAASPVCTPTRAAMLSGLHPARTRITDWTLWSDRDFSRAMPGLADPPWNREGLAPGPQLLTERLRAVGYTTILAGKGHFAAVGQPGADPRALGFDVSIAGHAPGGPGSYLGERSYGNDQPNNVWAVPGLEKYHGSNVFLTDALTREARAAVANAVREAPERPFLLWFAHYAVHVPLEPDARFVQRYREQGLSEPEACYAAMIEGVDQSLGELWHDFEDLGIAENTLLVYFSDNGGLSAHARGPTPDGTGAHTHNAPLRSGKGAAYEGGIRVPLLACWAAPRRTGAPARIVAPPPGSRCATPVFATEFFATFLAIAYRPSSRPAIAASTASPMKGAASTNANPMNGAASISAMLFTALRSPPAGCETGGVSAGIAGAAAASISYSAARALLSIISGESGLRRKPATPAALARAS